MAKTENEGATGEETERANMREELQALKEDMVALRRDLKNFASAAMQTGRRRAGDAKDRVVQAAGDVQETVSGQIHDLSEAACEKAEYAAEHGREQVRQHPFSYVLGALALGVILGKLVWRDKC